MQIKNLLDKPKTNLKTKVKKDGDRFAIDIKLDLSKEELAALGLKEPRGSAGGTVRKVNRMDRLEKKVDDLTDTVSTLAASVSSLAKSTEQGFMELRQDVKEIKEDVHILKQDVKVLKQDVNILKQDVGLMKSTPTMAKEINQIKPSTE